MKVIFLNIMASYRKSHIYEIGSDNFFLFGIGQFIGTEFIANGYNVNVEIWRVDERIGSIMEKKIRGLQCRIFPADKQLKLIKGFSSNMAKMFKSESKNQETVFHFMGTHLLSYHIYAFWIGKNRVIATHLGNPNPFWRYQKSKSLKHLVFYLAERYFFLNYYKCIATICKSEVSYYKKVGVPVKEMSVYGIARENKFIIKDRLLCREKLGLPLDKKIILQVGRAVEYRGFDWMLNVIDYYSENDDYLLIFLGINEWDPYYNELLKRNCIVKEYMKHTDLVDYYNAADVFIFFIVGEKVLTFGGTGYVPIESLACGTPVVATSLHHINNTRITEVSRIPSGEKDIIPMIEELISMNINRELCRKITLEIFSWDTILKKYWDIYSNNNS